MRYCLIDSPKPLAKHRIGACPAKYPRLVAEPKGAAVRRMIDRTACTYVVSLGFCATILKHPFGFCAMPMMDRHSAKPLSARQWPHAALARIARPSPWAWPYLTTTKRCAVPAWLGGLTLRMYTPPCKPGMSMACAPAPPWSSLPCAMVCPARLLMA